MLASAKNYDVICLQMWNYLPQQDEPVRRKTMRFIEDVKHIIISGSPIKPKLDKFLPKIFNFRLLALKWICQQPDIDLGHLLDEAYPSLEALRNNPKLAMLAENTLFAVRCNSRVLQAIIEEDDSSSEDLSKQFSEARYASYQQFFGTLALEIPDQEAFQTFVDFCHASLYIEFILLAAIMINEEKIDVSEATVNELAFLIADAAQEYSAIATLMGILPLKGKTISTTKLDTDTRSADDDLLSNLGLFDFAKNF